MLSTQVVVQSQPAYMRVCPGELQKYTEILLAAAMAIMTDMWSLDLTCDLIT